MKIVLINKKLNFNYYVLDTYEAGVVLQGSEVKSLYYSQGDINDAYIVFKKNEPFLLNMHIKPYQHGSYYNPDPLRSRKLLLNRSQIIKLQHLVKKEKLTLIPKNLYWKNKKLKITVALCKGKKLYDKRRTIKEKDLQKESKFEI